MENQKMKANDTNKIRKEITLFLSVIIVLSAIFESLIIGTWQMFYAAFLMWTPALAAWITKFVYFQKEKNSLLFQKCKMKYIFIALGLPMIYLGIPYCIYWINNPSSMQIDWSLKLVGMAVVGILTTMVITLGEEIGWRGFLVPRLTAWVGAKKTLLFTGLFWGAWHCPLLLSGIYMPGISNWYKVPLFMIVITSVGVIIGGLTLRSKSVWPAVLMHAAHNNFDQNLLGAGTVGNDKMYFVGETGIITAVIVVVIAVGVYKEVLYEGIVTYKEYKKIKKSEE